MTDAATNRFAPSELSEPDVSDAIARIAARDPALAREAADAYESMTWGEGPGVLRQAAVQEWLWYIVPTKYITDEIGYMGQLARAAAALFDEIGLYGYGAICQSSETARVHAAFDRSDSEGITALRQAMQRSGIVPPDMADFAWSDLMGAQEAAARSAVEDTLERVISAGEARRGGPRLAGQPSAGRGRRPGLRPSGFCRVSRGEQRSSPNGSNSGSPLHNSGASSWERPGQRWRTGCCTPSSRRAAPQMRCARQCGCSRNRRRASLDRSRLPQTVVRSSGTARAALDLLHRAGTGRRGARPTTWCCSNSGNGFNKQARCASARARCTAPPPERTWLWITRRRGTGSRGISCRRAGMVSCARQRCCTWSTAQTRCCTTRCAPVWNRQPRTWAGQRRAAGNPSRPSIHDVSWALAGMFSVWRVCGLVTERDQWPNRRLVLTPTGVAAALTYLRHVGAGPRDSLW